MIFRRLVFYIYTTMLQYMHVQCTCTTFNFIRRVQGVISESGISITRFIHLEITFEDPFDSFSVLIEQSSENAHNR